MIYVTGDTHGSYSRIAAFCNEQHLGVDDVIIVLGDTGLNYYGDERDVKKKRKVSTQVSATLAFIHGNHDLRPETISSYEKLKWKGGMVYQEQEFLNLVFLKDGELFELDGQKVMVAGGAYSVDKAYRLQQGYKWFADEQPSPEIKAQVEDKLAQNDWVVDVMLTHTCPLKYEPKEALFASIDQRKVDKSTEQWLDTLEDRLVYKRWFCGHFHIDKRIDKISFLFKDIVAL